MSRFTPRSFGRIVLGAGLFFAGLTGSAYADALTEPLGGHFLPASATGPIPASVTGPIPISVTGPIPALVDSDPNDPAPADFAAALSPVPDTAANTVQSPTLKNGVRVIGPQVRLGDLFNNAGPHSNEVVATAPAPGNALVFEGGWLAVTARSHGLDWQPPSGQSQIRVERASVTLGNTEIITKLSESLIGGRHDLRLQLEGQYQLHAPADDTTGIGVTNLTLDHETNRFSAELRVPADDVSSQPLRVAGRIEQIQAVPVLTRSLMPGEIVRAEDIAWIDQRTDSLSPINILDAHDLIGRTPRHAIRAEQPLRKGDLEIPVVVHRNDLVLIVLERPGLYLTAEGRALEDGGRGAVIRVNNTQSNRAIDAVILGSGRVAVQSLAQQQALN